jgi:hypothetical protein
VTALLIIATLIGAWCIVEVYRHETPTWLCIALGGIVGLPVGLPLITLIGGGL